MPNYIKSTSTAHHKLINTIRHRMIDLDLDDQTFASRAGLKPGLWSEYKHERRVLSLKVIDKLCKAAQLEWALTTQKK